jgi:hypothetical protein
VLLRKIGFDVLFIPTQNYDKILFVSVEEIARLRYREMNSEYET